VLVIITLPLGNIPGYCLLSVKVFKMILIPFLTVLINQITQVLLNLHFAVLILISLKVFEP